MVFKIGYYISFMLFFIIHYLVYDIQKRNLNFYKKVYKPELFQMLNMQPFSEKQLKRRIIASKCWIVINIIGMIICTFALAIRFV